jgi:hypothetical protein
MDNEQLKKYGLILLIVVIIIYLMCDSNKTENFQEGYNNNYRYLENNTPIYNEENFASMRRAKKAKSSKSRSSKAPVKSQARAVSSSTIAFPSGGSISDTTQIVTVAPPVPTLAQPQDLMVNNLSFGADKSIYFAREDNDLRLTGGALAVDKICIGDETRCFDITSLPSLTLGNKLMTQYGQQGMHMFSQDPTDSYIFEIFDAEAQQLIMKASAETDYDRFKYGPGTESNYKAMIKYGSATRTTDDADGNGAFINVPDGTEMLWVRVANDRITNIKAYYNIKDTTGKYVDVIGNFVTGFRRLFNISPDGGSAHDSAWASHAWYMIPITKSGNGQNIGVFLTANKFIVDNTQDPYKSCGPLYISGIAFTTNPWKLALNSAFTYAFGLNGLSKYIHPSYNYGLSANDQWTLQMNPMYVPVVPSGKDKLLYFVMAYNMWGANERNSHVYINVNGRVVERLRATYENPFSRHYRSNHPYMACRIPKELINPSDKFLTVSVNVQRNESFMIREIGTHDINLL